MCRQQAFVLQQRSPFDNCALSVRYVHSDSLCLQGLRDPHVAVHGSFSFMVRKPVLGGTHSRRRVSQVNLHAVRLYTLARGGISLHTPYLEVRRPLLSRLR